MRIARLNKQNTESIIVQTLKILHHGGLVVFPTDTVYGLLVDTKNKEAVEKVIQFKARPAGRAISIFVADLVMMKQYVSLTKIHEQRLKSILPGPYTIVLPSRGKANSLLEAENRTLGVRIPDYSLVTELVKRFGGPVTATSANLSGKPSVYSVTALLYQLSQKKKEMIDLIVDAGHLPRNKPSTVVDFTQDSLKILRRGDKDLSNTKRLTSTSEDETKEIAKKILASFLSKKPNKPLVFILQGDLGAGKTIFVKGLGESLGVERIISPTFVIYYEYPLKDKNVFVHFDLYKVQEASEFKHLGVEKYLQPGNILAFEWGDNCGGR